MADGELEFGALISVALRNDLGGTHHATKTIMRWTGASERSVKNWLAGTYGPSGVHLVQLARHSDEVFHLFLLMAGRKPLVTNISLIRLRSQLTQTIERIDRHLT